MPLLAALILRVRLGPARDAFPLFDQALHKWNSCKVLEAVQALFTEFATALWCVDVFQMSPSDNVR